LESLSDQSQSLLSMSAGLGQDHEIIGAPDEPVTALVELPIQEVEDNVGQQRRNDTALRGADRGGLEHAVFHNARAQEFLDQVENVPVGNLGCDSLLDDGMWKIVKEPFNVGVGQERIPG
jgi:hypothetical protein